MSLFIFKLLKYVPEIVKLDSFINSIVFLSATQTFSQTYKGKAAEKRFQSNGQT